LPHGNPNRQIKKIRNLSTRSGTLGNQRLFPR
jgi:hypothetical protein